MKNLIHIIGQTIFEKFKIHSFRIGFWIRWTRYWMQKSKLFWIHCWCSQLIDIGAFVGMPLLNFERLNEFLYDLSSQYILVLSYEQEWNRIAIFKRIYSLYVFYLIRQSAGKPVRRKISNLLQIFQPISKLILIFHSVIGWNSSGRSKFPSH